MSNIRCQSKLRMGISLLEVIVATIILSVSAAMLVRLLGNGDRQARRAGERIQAQMICQNKLDEIVASIEPLESFDPRPSLYYPDWYYSVLVQDLDESGLDASVRFSLVEVSVFYQKSDEEFREPGAIHLRDAKPVYSLRRMVRRKQSSTDPAESDFLSGEFK